MILRPVREGSLFELDSGTWITFSVDHVSSLFFSLWIMYAWYYDLFLVRVFMCICWMEAETFVHLETFQLHLKDVMCDFHVILTDCCQESGIVCWMWIMHAWYYDLFLVRVFMCIWWMLAETFVHLETFQLYLTDVMCDFHVVLIDCCQESEIICWMLSMLSQKY